MNNTNFISILLKGRGFSSAPWMNKHKQKGRTLLPICEADVPLFLSAMYNKKYTSEKIANRYPQSGRSMIEMLGVLAIIGVLSVGGIAGYSKAMQRYRINKTIEQITLIAGNVRTFFSTQDSYEGLDCWCHANDCYNTTSANCPIIRKAKLFPEEMLVLSDNKLNDIINLYGYSVAINASNKSQTDDKQAFSLTYRFPFDEEICIELLTKDWGAAGTDYMFLSYGGGFTPPLSIDIAVKTCSNAKSGSLTNSINNYVLYIYFGVNDNCKSYGGNNTCS